MTTKRLFIIIIFLSIFVLMLGLTMGYDTWWHLKTGEMIWETKSIMDVDPFSYTKYGQEWRGPATNWVSELSMFAMFHLMSFSGLMLWVAIPMTLTFGFIFIAMEGDTFWKGFVLIIGVVVMSAYRLPRPVIVSTLMVAVFLWRFELFRKKEKNYLWCLPILMVFWTNSHGGILLAVLLWGVYFVNELIDWIKLGLEEKTETPFLKKPWFKCAISGRIGHLLLIAILLLIALSINPAGPRIFIYTFEQMDVDLALAHIKEWQSPDFHVLPMQIMFGMFTLAILLIIYSSRKVLLTDALLLLGFFGMTLVYSRFLPYFVIVALLVISRYGDAIIKDVLKWFSSKIEQREKKQLPEKISIRLNWILLIIVLLVSSVVVVDQYFVNNDFDSYLRERFPVDAVAFLEENGVKGSLFNRYGYGGYIIWALPEVPVFVDGRADLYKDELLSEYILINNAELGWQEALENWDIQTVLVSPDAIIAKVLPYENWELVYADDIAVIFFKK